MTQSLATSLSGDSSPPEGPLDAVATVRGLGHSYGAVQALADIDGTFFSGQLTVLLGANGSGKTTLLRLLAGQLPPSRGHIDWLREGRPLAAGRRYIRRHLRRHLRRHIAYLSQRSALDPEMSVGETLPFLATLQGIPRSQRRPRCETLAATFGLLPLASRRVEELSGGQRRRLHLAAGLLHEAPLLLLDEPDVGLDVEGQRALWQTLRQRVAEGVAVVAVTHHRAMAEEHADVAWLLTEGRLVERGPAAEVLAHHEVPEPSQGRGPGRGSRRGRGSGRGRGRHGGGS